MQRINPFAVLGAHITQDSLLYSLYLPHAAMVTAKAVRAARRLGLPRESEAFIEEAALLHDIGVVRTNEPRLGCHGQAPYLQHGVLGREILEAEGLPRHGLVAERHIGVGLSREEILANELPLPARDFHPQSVEERIIAWADLYFSKKPEELWMEKPAGRVYAEMARFGEDKAAIFEAWRREFEG
jgi:uncharacterized protein